MIKIGQLRFHPIDGDGDIEVEIDGWSYFMSIKETEKLINFLTEQFFTA